jgi:long-chain fatty acid transport protein
MLMASVAGDAYAGGFEIPDNGAQALGRGATFVAKADDGTAIYYNPAGLARQRGTRLYAGGNLFLHSFELQRAGSFPDDPNDASTPWAGKPFPLVTNSAGPFFAPFIAASTDFASLDRLTVAIGAFGPPVVGNRTFPLAIRNAPAASRYDFVQSRSTLVFPTASAAYRVTPWLDLGLSAHLVLASFDQTMVSYADVGQCPNVEYQPCDSRGTLAATATSFAATFGALVRPSPNVAFGLSVRTPTNLEAQGTLVPQSPKNLPVQISPGQAFLSTRLPLIVRGGIRYIAMDGDFELYDLEVDATYEGWSAAQGDGPRIRIPALGSFKNIDTLIVHGYSDTFSARIGGAYNFEALDGVLAFRAGGFFDSPATSYAYTRLDFDTLTKIAGTLGLGYKRSAVSFDVGYAAVASVPRLVGTDQGDVRPVNLAQRGRPVDNDGKLLPAVNEGAYKGFTHILSVGLSVTFDELFGAARPFHYGNTYERGYVAPGEDAKGDKDGDRERERERERDRERERERDDDGAEKPARPKKDVDAPPPEDVQKPAEKKPVDKRPDKPLEKKKEWWEDAD